MSSAPPGAGFDFDNTYARLGDGFSIPWKPQAVARPLLLKLNESLAEELRLDVAMLRAEGAALLSGSRIPEGSESVAQAYAGHQFGGFVPQLGDGRAILLGEVIDTRGRRHDIAMKGSGPTPFSRGGDGKAAIGPVLREYLMGEAMHALGIPTTRALAAVSTGESIRRDELLPGAVLTRVAASHIRVGTFEFFAARRQFDQLKTLADYAIERHDPSLGSRPNRYLEFLDAVVSKQAHLVAQWMLVGFIHGVMNTDNMTISGETIDYGPCAFMEAYRSDEVFSSIDHGGRYAYRNQPLVAQWNLARFAETLLYLIDPSQPESKVPEVMAILEEFPARYETHWQAGLRRKLGLSGEQAEDPQLAQDWLTLLEREQVDFTLAWRYLANAQPGDPGRLGTLFSTSQPLESWLIRWHQRRSMGDSSHAIAPEAWQSANPLFIPRNHRVEEALADATRHQDLTRFDRLLAVVTQPFQEHAGCEDLAQPASDEFTACYKTYCGT